MQIKKKIANGNLPQGISKKTFYTAGGGIYWKNTKHLRNMCMPLTQQFYY